jgi:hypothetical protein
MAVHVLGALGGRRVWRSVAVGLVAVLAAVSLALVLPGGAQANHLSLSISSGSSARIVSGVYLAVPVQISCPDVSADLFSHVYFEQVFIDVTQKTSGQGFAHGTAWFTFTDQTLLGGAVDGTPLTCDGALHSYTVNVWPDTGGSPFHGGRALVQASLTIVGQDPNDPWSSFDFNSAASGPMEIHLRG